EKLDTQTPLGFFGGVAAVSQRKPRFFADDPAKIESITMLETFAIRHQCRVKRHWAQPRKGMCAAADPHARYDSSGVI
ncbi:MAG: hypothetical protein ACLU98_09285, partial [Desulfovibrio fairfieldensis]